jgi:hypothetical protein
MTIEQVSEVFASEPGSAGIAGGKKDTAASGGWLFICVEDGKTLIVEN